MISDYKLARKVILPRQKETHKGSYGRLLLIGGLAPYGGAIIMAALAALKSGAGLITVATDQTNISALTFYRGKKKPTTEKFLVFILTLYQ